MMTPAGCPFWSETCSFVTEQMDSEGEAVQSRGEVPAGCDPLCHDDVLFRSLVESLKQYAAADGSSFVAIELLSSLVFQPPVAAAGRLATDKGEPLSPQVFLPPVVAAVQVPAGEGASQFLPMSPQLVFAAGPL